MSLIIRWFISALSILLVSYLVPGIVVTSFYTALIVALFFGFLNAVVKPILIVLTLPVHIVTLGLSLFILNGFLFWFLSTLIKGFVVRGFWAAIIGAVVVSLFTWVGNKLVKEG